MLFHWTALKFHISLLFFLSQLQYNDGRQRADGSNSLSSLLLSLLSNQRLVDVWDHTTASYGSLDKRIQLFITTDRKLQVTWRDPLHLEVLRSITCQLQHLGSEVLQDRSAVHGSSGPDPSMARGASLQMPVDAAHGKLQSSSLWARHCLSLGLPTVLSSFASSLCEKELQMKS